MQNKSNSQTTILSGARESVLATNKVLRNTYFLLSLTLIFSAAVAYYAMVTNAPFLGFFSFILWFGLLFLTQALRNSVWGLVSIFAFTGLGGYMMGPLINLYLAQYINGGQIVATSLFGTAVIFLTLSVYTLVTKKNFSYLGGFLCIGLITMIGMSLIGTFFAVPMLVLIASAVSIMIMSGYILYETSAIIHGGQTNYILATISLYISIYIIFQNLLMILGALTGNSRD